MKRLTEYITEYVSSGRIRPSFPKDTDLKDITNLIDFLESVGFRNATGNTADIKIMSSIISVFEKSNKPVYIFNEYHIDGVKSYWLRFFSTYNKTRNITEDNPIFTISYNPWRSNSGSASYFIEKTVGDETITQMTREEFMDLLNKHFGWN